MTRTAALETMAEIIGVFARWLFFLEREREKKERKKRIGGRKMGGETGRSV